MSVSAHPTPQPGTEEYRSVFVGKALEQLGEILTRYPTRQAALLHAAWLLKQARGWISDRNMDAVAEVLAATPPSERGVVTVCSIRRPRREGRQFGQDLATS